MTPSTGHFTMITIWGRTNSINVQKVIWTADEIGVPYQRIDAGMAFGINSTPEYRAMNPNGMIPVMKDGDFVLLESNAICRYLVDAHAPGALYPSAPQLRAVVDQWMDWAVTELVPAIGPTFHNLVRFAADKRDPAVIEAGRTKTELKLVVLESRLATTPYVAGDAFTLADLIIGLGVNRWHKMPISRQPTPAIDSWFAKLATRPGAQQALAVMLT
jgi:glutathione S-transferase